MNAGSYISPSSALTQRFAEPLAVAELRVDRGLLFDLALKTLFYEGRMTRAELSEAMRISTSATQELMHALTQDGLADVVGIEGTGPSNFIYALTQRGVGRAEAALDRSGYVGPAPVRLDDYVERIRLQTVDGAALDRKGVEQALAPLVLHHDDVARIGRAAASRKSLLLHGPSGNGKTTAVRAIGEALGGAIYIPHAIEMVGQIVHLFDPSKHELLPDGDVNPRPNARRADQRWVRIRRPAIWAGGELTPDSLELVYDAKTRVYEAPLQLKANGGTLIIDDFGRQQMPAVRLLNRWIGALEGRVDHLALHTGQTIEVPFDVLVLFSTNLSPSALADDAFLRRIRYKVELPNPTPDDFDTIFQRECELAGIDYSHSAVTHLLTRWYEQEGRELRGCHPRDLVEALVDAATYEGREPHLTPAALDDVCATYFLSPMNAPA